MPHFVSLITEDDCVKQCINNDFLILSSQTSLHSSLLDLTSPCTTTTWPDLPTPLPPPLATAPQRLATLFNRPNIILHSASYSGSAPLRPSSPVRPAPAAVHWRLFAEHRGAEPNQLQHTVCSQDTDDHMSGHGAARVHGVFMDHCLMDLAAVWEVRQTRTDKQRNEPIYKHIHTWHTQTGI